MPSYKVTDSQSGKSLTLTGDSPPSEQEIAHVFSQIGSGNSPAQSNSDVSALSGAASPLMRGLGSIIQDPIGNPVSKGLLTNEPVGFIGGIARTIPATALGMASGPAGALAGEALRQDAVALNSNYGNTQAPSILDAVGRPVVAGVSQKVSDFAAPYLASAITKAGQFGGEAIKDIARYSGINLAGIKPASYAVAEGAPGSVRGYVGAGPDTGDTLADRVRSLIAGAVKKGEDAYPTLIDAAKSNPAYAGKTIDLQNAVGDKVLEIADKYGFQSVPGLKAPGEGAKFWEFAGQIDKLKDAPVEQVYNFQKQLNSLANSNYGSPLGSAFKSLKSAVSDVLGKEIPEIGQANSAYAAAKSLEEHTGDLKKNNDLLSYVTKVFKNEHDTLKKKAIEEAYQHIPGLEDTIRNIRAYAAAQDFTPLVRSLPQTGMGASIFNGFMRDPAIAGGASAYYTGSPLAGAGAGAAVFAKNLTTSPRLALSALEAAQAAAPAIQGASNVAAAAAPAGSSALAQAYMRMSPASLAALLRAPRVSEPDPAMSQIGGLRPK